MTTKVLNQVFISYRHESPEHARDVLGLAELLREAGIPIALDQLLLDQYPGGPDEGWPKWCEDCATKSKCVLIIPSAGWFAAYNKTAPRQLGLGAATEADLFRQALWDEKGNNARIRLAFVRAIAADDIPRRLRAWHQFRTQESNAELEQLIKWVASCLDLGDVELPHIHWPKPIVFSLDVPDRTEKEWPSIVDLLSHRSRERILFLEGESGVGKTALIGEAARYAKQLGFPVAKIEFQGGPRTVEDILGEIDLSLGAQCLPSFSQFGGVKTHLLRKDLRKLKQPLLLIFNNFKEIANNQSIVDWLRLQLLNELETSLGLCVIVSGRELPDYSGAPWRSLVKHIRLEPVSDPELWIPWIKKRFPNLNIEMHLRSIVFVSEGKLSAVIDACETILKYERLYGKL